MYQQQNGGECMKEYIEKRACDIAEYIRDNKATVRKTAQIYNVSKSTVHIDVTI